MKSTVLVDNISKDNIRGEWGLSIFIEHNGKNLLLDTGASKLFLENAVKLGIDIKSADYAVLSHAHFDHADGMRDFFRTNDTARFYLRDGSRENCYLKMWFFYKYVGIPRNILAEYKDRIVFANGDYALLPGVSLVPHKTPGLAAIGKKNSMYVRDEQGWEPDDFSHEQSLVFETSSGLIIFNSCSHGGADNIIREVSATFQGKKIHALVGGFHINNRPEAEVRAFARRIQATGIEAIYTGHCTGERSFHYLKDELGDSVHQLHSGLVMEF